MLLAGRTGSGKSTLLHAIATNAALRYSPAELELYLVDFKKGVEFKNYATRDLPQAQVVGVESEREFGLSVLERLDRELAILRARAPEATEALSREVVAFVQRLRAAGYSGPIGLQAYNVPGDPYTNLAANIATWRRIAAQLDERASNAAPQNVLTEQERAGLPRRGPRPRRLWGWGYLRSGRNRGPARGRGPAPARGRAH